MTDTVNVPREVLERLVAWINREVPVPTRSATRWAMDITDLLAAAPKAEPVSGDWYSAESIDALVLEIDIALNGENAAPQAKLCDLVKQIKELAQPEAPKGEPVAWRYRSAERPHLGWTKPEYSRRSPYGRIGMDEQPLFAHPAPAIDELLEAADFLADRVTDHEHSLEADDFYGHVLPALARYRLAKHKGPQS